MAQGNKSSRTAQRAPRRTRSQRSARAASATVREQTETSAASVYIPRGEALVARVSSFELESPLTDIQPDPGTDLLGIAATLAGKKHPGTSVTRSFMSETYGGGSLERVPDFDVTRAITAGLMHSGDAILPQLQQSPKRELEIAAADGLRAETVIMDPGDTRKPVANTAVVPWRCIALLNIAFADGFTARGTAWFIGPSTLVTAAHCVHDPRHGRAVSILVTPGFQRGAAPYGRFAVSKVDFNPAWTRGFPRELDFSLLYLADPLGLGFFGFAAASDDGLRSVLVNIAGYPDDRAGTQCYDAGRIVRVDSTFIYHTIDTESGQSGAPLFWSDQQQRVGLGIHTYGAGPSDRTNVARRITPQLYDLFESRKV
jgi:V8-like Glu-specific endopeptidase